MTTNNENKPIEDKPPYTLYYGTTKEKYTEFLLDRKITGSSGKVFLSSYYSAAEKIAKSKKGVPKVVKIDARMMHEDDYKFFLAENKKWFTKEIPVQYILFSKEDYEDEE